MPRKPARGVEVAAVRSLLLDLGGVTEGRSYGLPSFLLGGKFFARFRDRETVLVLQLGTIDDRDVLMRLDPLAFFFTDHYRDYPAVLIRLAEVPPQLLVSVVREAWEDLVERRGVERTGRPERATKGGGGRGRGRRA